MKDELAKIIERIAKDHEEAMISNTLAESEALRGASRHRAREAFGRIRALAEPENRYRDRLIWLLDMLKDREDVSDGSDGTQIPNEAMSLLADYEYKFGSRNA